jgi:alpha,alpha-trehalase
VHAARPVASVPSALIEWEEIAARASDRPLVAFLDFDGTLSGLVDDPDDAVLASGMAAALDALAHRATVAVVSGRGADDVRARIGRPDVWVAGSHGFEILAPTGERHERPDAAAAATALAEAATRLEEVLAGVDGVLVERKHLGLSVHDRMVDAGHVDGVRRAAAEEAARHPELRVTHGKRVTELRPDVDWHKGEAVRWLLGRCAPADDPVALYVGDDTTDEDAFAALGPDDLTVVVEAGGPPDRPTVAQWRVADPGEVRELLSRLASIAGRGPSTSTEHHVHGS